ncbi:uncharacterized protein LOC132759387 [Ruditapes philippinarum]|uniref:uncharacterized protein LOC132759387 n=1 Tax=Ruditapes philippinarum TaxID=129788 RepID=UPI00295C1A9E|nr:uncharacterized protein LOC132759387 [Ruditapes philippinarum]
MDIVNNKENYWFTFSEDEQRRLPCARKMFPIHEKNESPWSLHISLLNTKEIESQYCACSAGKGSCAHVAALVYQLAHYKTLKMKSVPDIVSKTSSPQLWQVPPRTHGIVPRQLSDVKFVKPKSKKNENSEQCVCSTLYNPINTQFPDIEFMKGLQLIVSNSEIQFNQVLPDNFDSIETKMSSFGSVLSGSCLAHQLPEPESDGSITRIPDGPEFPQLPFSTHDLRRTYERVLSENEQLFFDGIGVSQELAEELEQLTRKQSDCPEWHNLRKKRLTSSTFKDIVVRRKDFDTLTEMLSSSRKVQTAAMKHGIENEGNAVLEYATHKNVNIKPCGFVINPDAPFLGTSLDRIVYDPNEICQFGVLEVKCPVKESYTESQFLRENADGTYSLKHSHSYYLQVMGQMALTGLTWADFCVWTQNDMHIERIYFDKDVWCEAYEKLIVFYFDHFMRKFV